MRWHRKGSRIAGPLFLEISYINGQKRSTVIIVIHLIFFTLYTSRNLDHPPQLARDPEVMKTWKSRTQEQVRYENTCANR